MKKLLCLIALTTALAACNSGTTGSTTATSPNQVLQDKFAKTNNLLSLQEAKVKNIDNTLQNIPVNETGLKVLQLTNNSSSSSINLQPLPILPKGFDYNRSRTNCGKVLTANQSCNISIKFVPQAQGLRGKFKFTVNGVLDTNCSKGKQSCQLAASEDISYYSRTYMYFSQYNPAGSSNIKECLINNDGSIDMVNCKNVLPQNNNVKYTIAVQSYTEYNNIVFAIPSKNGAKGPLQKCNIVNNDTGEVSCTPFFLANNINNSSYPIWGDSYNMIFEYNSAKILLSTIPDFPYPFGVTPSMNANQVYACNLHLFQYVGINFENCIHNKNYVKNVTTPANYEMYLTDLLTKTNPVYYFNKDPVASSEPSLVLCPDRNTQLSNCKVLMLGGNGISSMSYYNNEKSKQGYIQFIQGNLLKICNYDSTALGSCHSSAINNLIRPTKIFNYGDNIYLVDNSAQNSLKLYVCKNDGRGDAIESSCSKVNILPDSNYNFFDINMIQPIALMQK